MSSLVLPAIIARPPKDPLPQLATHRDVNIYHPKVLRGQPILQFSAFPSNPDGGVVGVPLGVVLDACSIVAGNKRGQLHRYVPPQERVAGDGSDPDALLVPGVYLFIVVQAGGALDYNYHLCASFAAWTPPVAIPDRWKGGEPDDAPPAPHISNISAAVVAEDKVCIMTGAATCLQANHLVPKAEEAWFNFHAVVLEGYGGRPSADLNSVRNEVALRADLNSQGLDQGLFLFTPYAQHVVAVFVKPMTEDLAHEYHTYESGQLPDANPPRISLH
ncbi:hypothetical protein B0H19DRAFT_460649 [Mycena capillaripes]|nr:hypothetical protein B0H19DRAFT_460649 [Mycena capillaripes]